MGAVHHPSAARRSRRLCRQVEISRCADRDLLSEIAAISRRPTSSILSPRVVFRSAKSCRRTSSACRCMPISTRRPRIASSRLCATRSRLDPEGFARPRQCSKAVACSGASSPSADTRCSHGLPASRATSCSPRSSVPVRWRTRFFVALRLPNAFRAIFAEGAFNTAFVPAYAHVQGGQGEASAKLFR